ncbi:hypothetical protein NDU88_006182 [Pleurodeles waltl]|uniref:Uncharacterized protein n=1 Tax=Pleurodeles waltl TaxID=8319 RepID=A0AAV7QMV3_PLEWA|nr:hypothetical protein NDU88_006182 [Pleurodeles waltl]
MPRRQRIGRSYRGDASEAGWHQAEPQPGASTSKKQNVPIKVTFLRDTDDDMGDSDNNTDKEDPDIMICGEEV